MAIGNFNFDDTKRQARTIRDRAHDMRSLKNGKLNNAVQSIGAVWKGEAARRYLDHCGGTMNDIDGAANALDEIAGRIEEAAEILRRAEDEARRQMGH